MTIQLLMTTQLVNYKISIIFLVYLIIMTHTKINSYLVILYQSIQYSNMTVSNCTLPYPE